MRGFHGQNLVGHADLILALDDLVLFKCIESSHCQMFVRSVEKPVQREIYVKQDLSPLITVQLEDEEKVLQKHLKKLIILIRRFVAVEIKLNDEETVKC